jgi:hypothetical protein
MTSLVDRSRYHCIANLVKSFWVRPRLKCIPVDLLYNTEVFSDSRGVLNKLTNGIGRVRHSLAHSKTSMEWTDGRRLMNVEDRTQHCDVLFHNHSLMICHAELFEH